MKARAFSLIRPSRIPRASRQAALVGGAAALSFFATTLPAVSRTGFAGLGLRGVRSHARVFQAVGKSRRGLAATSALMGKKVLIINGAQSYPFAPGSLTQSFVELATDELTSRGYEVKHTKTDGGEGWDVDEELKKHQWADAVILQHPLNWMGVPWSLKKYQDDVYTAGMSGILCQNDGRTRENPKKNYGTGGTLPGKKYMISLTSNAPAESFNDESEYLFEGKSVDDLMMPTHCNFKFFAMEALPTFSSHDVMKNPEIESDFARFKEHLAKHFP
mmetsp:Transcript_16218/g.31696  ORF Transcript_16218/g.31696 Transcript_16218/m.31696 type:complete len:275 (-) Transcript_16218:224-1048(-)